MPITTPSLAPLLYAPAHPLRTHQIMENLLSRKGAAPPGWDWRAELKAMSNEDEVASEALSIPGTALCRRNCVIYVDMYM